MYHIHLWESVHKLTALKMASSRVLCLDAVAKMIYVEKLTLLDMNADEDPYQITNSVGDMMLWPPVTYGDIFCYFIDRPGVYTRLSPVEILGGVQLLPKWIRVHSEVAKNDLNALVNQAKSVQIEPTMLGYA